MEELYGDGLEGEILEREGLKELFLFWPNLRNH